jgi:hypothetical protein
MIDMLQSYRTWIASRDFAIKSVQFSPDTASVSFDQIPIELVKTILEHAKLIIRFFKF